MIRKAPPLILCIVGLMVPSANSSLAAQTEAWNDSATEVVVKASIPGPAMWRVKKGQSEVIVIGILPVMPRSLNWNTRRIGFALKGAKGLITPPKANLNLGDMLKMMSAKNLPKGTMLKDVLPQALNTRYETTAARAGVSIKAFDHDKPVWAGARLRKDVLAKLSLTDDEPVDTIVRLAHRQGVDVRTSGRYKLSPILKDINAMDMASSRNCLSAALDDIDFDIDRSRKTAIAWTTGDLKTVRANYQGSALQACFDGSEKGQALIEHSIDDATNAIEEALETPGKSVAIFQLSPLLRKGGALDRLKAHGAQITAPEY